jgi:hypothetical protein
MVQREAHAVDQASLMLAARGHSVYSKIAAEFGPTSTIRTSPKKLTRRRALVHEARPRSYAGPHADRRGSLSLVGISLERHADESHGAPTEPLGK